MTKAKGPRPSAIALASRRQNQGGNQYRYLQSKRNWLRFLFSIEGRANRAEFWLIGISLHILWSIFNWATGNLAAKVMGWLGLGIRLKAQPGYPGSYHFTIDLSDYPSMVWAIGIALVVHIIVYLPFWWIQTALFIKRLHDRDRSAWWLVSCFLSVLAIISAVVVIAITLHPPSSVAWIATVAMMIFPLWILVETWFLPGTAGDNRFGPEP